MIYGNEACPRKQIIKRSISWVFALILGLVVSIYDVRLSAEPGTGKVDVSRPSDRDANFLHDAIADNDEPAFTDFSTTVFVPKGEPELLPFDRAIHQAAGRHDVDADLILAIIMAESQLNPTAKSKKGAKGLMQLMPFTAEAFEVVDIFNPEENVDAGTRYLRELLDRCDGDIKLALAAYNAGMQSIIRYDGIPPFAETRAYVSRVLEHYAALKRDSFQF
jgi:hypothetical protein